MFAGRERGAFGPALLRRLRIRYRREKESEIRRKKGKQYKTQSKSQNKECWYEWVSSFFRAAQEIHYCESENYAEVEYRNIQSNIIFAQNAGISIK